MNSQWRPASAPTFVRGLTMANLLERALPFAIIKQCCEEVRITKWPWVVGLVEPLRRVPGATDNDSYFVVLAF